MASIQDTWSLEGKRAIVTGAGRGLGRACALMLAAAGAEVVAVARTATDLESLKREAVGPVVPWPADVADHEFYARIEELERLEVLVNNAGINRPQPLVEVTDANLDLMLGLNVRAAFKTAQSAARVMRTGEGGAIVNMSSQMGHVGSPGRTVYCMTKHALEGLTKAMAVELAPDGIRVNSVAPTFVDTPMTRPMFENPEFRRFVLDSIPLGKLAEVGDVAAAVLFLASPAAAMITGTSLLVDGGWTAR